MMRDADGIRWRKSSRSDSSGGACVEVGSFTPTTAVQRQKSSYSDSSGVEWGKLDRLISVPSQWNKSSRSDSSGAEYVEVALSGAAVAVRDSKDPDGPKLVFGPDAWRAFAGRVKGGHLDLV